MKHLSVDPTVLAGLAQSLAAVVAVLFGWGLSVLTERRSWKRRKIEQLRDRQITILSQIVMDFRTALGMSEQAIQIAREVTQIAAQDGDEKAKTMLNRDAGRRLRELRGGLSAVLSQVEAQEMALRLIGYGQRGLIAIGEALRPLRALAIGRDVRQELSPLDASLLTSDAEEFQRLVSSFLANGAGGLSA